jgi:periplasmic binding family protein
MSTVYRCKTVMLSQRAGNDGAAIAVFAASALLRGLLCVRLFDVVADIYLGKVAKWNDAAIGALNPGVKLPDQKITVVHRSDGSGTRFARTNAVASTTAAP